MKDKVVALLRSIISCISKMMYYQQGVSIDVRWADALKPATYKVPGPYPISGRSVDSQTVYVPKYASVKVSGDGYTVVWTNTSGFSKSVGFNVTGTIETDAAEYHDPLYEGPDWEEGAEDE